MLVRYCTPVALKRHERVNASNLILDVSERVDLKIEEMRKHLGALTNNYRTSYEISNKMTY